MINYDSVGKQIKIERTRQGLTQDKVAIPAGISASHLSDIERGRTKPSFQTLLNIANVLHVSLDYLFCFEADNPKSHEFAKNMISEELADCTRIELTFLYDIVTAAKQSLRTLYKNGDSGDVSI